MIGLGTAPDFDSGPHVFDKEGGENVIESKDDEAWYFDGLSVNEHDINIHDDSDSRVTLHRHEASPYSDSKFGYIYKIEGEWFTIHKLNNRNIQIITNKNNTDSIRKLWFRIMAGNPTNTIYVEQKAE